jgi:hypothetical protein
MITPMDLVLGGLVPLAAAALAFTAAWFATHRAGAAWSAGVVVGYAAGALGLTARGAGLAAAATRLVRPLESQDWLPLIALAAAVPALAAALTRREWVEWLLAVPICLAAPARLLWSKYRASQQLREAGFAEDAITPTGAAVVLAAIATATLVAWILWRRAERESLPKTRSLLAIVALTGVAAVVALTGSLVLGQACGVLAAALGGCAVAAWPLGAKAGPESARGPALLLASCLLAAAVCYSELKPWQAATLAVALVLPVAWLPVAGRLILIGQAALRTAACLIPLTLVAWNAAGEFLAHEQIEEEQEADGSDLYNDYFAPSTPAQE